MGEMEIEPIPVHAWTAPLSGQRQTQNYPLTIGHLILQL